MGRAIVNDMSRDELIRELRRLAAKLDRPLAARDVPLGTWRAVLRCFGSVASAREAADLPGPSLNHRWSEDGVLDEIRRLDGARVTVTHQGLKHAGREDLVGAIVMYFGSIVRARRLARVPDPPRRVGVWTRWDEERVIGEILERHRAGEPLASSKVPGKFVMAAIRYFGSWPAAIAAAGLDYDCIRLRRPKYTDRELLGLLRELARKRPDMPRDELSTLPYRASLRERFGSIEGALRRAGLQGWPERVREQTLTATEVVKAIRARRRAGTSTYVTAVKADDHLVWFSGMVHYGDWDRVLVAARLESDAPQRSWKREQILDELRARHSRGESIRTTDVLRDDPALYHAARSHFGGYVAAAREIDGAPWATVRWTRSLLVAELKRLAGKRKRVTQEEAGGRIAQASARHFGTFTAACRAAGLLTEHDFEATRARARRRSERRPRATR